jgi:hypothetical protein
MHSPIARETLMKNISTNEITFTVDNKVGQSCSYTQWTLAWYLLPVNGAKLPSFVCTKITRPLNDLAHHLNYSFVIFAPYVNVVRWKLNLAAKVIPDDRSHWLQIPLTSHTQSGSFLFFFLHSWSSMFHSLLTSAGTLCHVSKSWSLIHQQHNFQLLKILYWWLTCCCKGFCRHCVLIAFLFSLVI